MQKFHIVTGCLKKRAFYFPFFSKRTRLTMSKVREAIFDYLQHLIDWSTVSVLDAFAGSGSLGFEAISRGAKYVLFCDNHQGICNWLYETINIIGIKNASVKCCDVLTIKQSKAFDLIFIDPPYNKDLINAICEHLYKTELIHKDSLLCIESSILDAPKEISNFVCQKHAVYSNSTVSFWYPSFY
ncbi:MAG: RsmD family RNA methyltransferase [Alphaproteobacteria bacterium]